MVLVQVQSFETGTRYELEIFCYCGKRVKTKSQKVLGAKSYVCRSYRGKTGRGGAFSPPRILNRVNSNVHFFGYISITYVFMDLPYMLTCHVCLFLHVMYAFFLQSIQDYDDEIIFFYGVWSQNIFDTTLKNWYESLALCVLRHYKQVSFRT